MKTPAVAEVVLRSAKARGSTLPQWFIQKPGHGVSFWQRPLVSPAGFLAVFGREDALPSLRGAIFLVT